ncbi:MAG TPA: HAMP domain-containing sensor histidine kinase [Caulobacteraceae bacterium]|nr:HAMP domain-containing sensor histidine kinase [Caulobacteraceae bacterium]
MADDSSQPSPAPSGGRRLRWPGGLSGRLLLATALIVVLANVLIVPALLANREQEWLSERVAAGELVSFVVEAAPGGKVTDQLASKMLSRAGVILVAIQSDGVRRLVIALPRQPRTPYLIDLRNQDPISVLSAPLQTLFGGGGRVVRVIDRPRYQTGEFVEVLAPDGPLRETLLANLGELSIGALFTSAMAGVLVYLSLNLFLVRPMRRITVSMERFRADPNDEAASMHPSGRHDEIGRAEAELERMQSDLRAALASRARFAALGEAVAKINHEMRNMLTSAQLASERLAASGDPVVARTLPRLERALDRAVTLATNVLAYGRSEEPEPSARPVPLRAALEAAAEDARLAPGGVELVANIDDRARVLADPDQLHRMLVNLMRNAREAMDGDLGRRGKGKVAASLRVEDGVSVLRLADDGPGVPERARVNLFEPFQGSTRRGGAGLGLAISRELAHAHGGDIQLVETSPQGTTFDIRLPGAPEPLPPTADAHSASSG